MCLHGVRRNGKGVSMNSEELTKQICEGRSHRTKRLTKKELTICREVERLQKENEGWIEGYCFVNGQRATLSDARLLYHEGYVTGSRYADADGRMRHAWNSLNGKLVDFSFPVNFVEQHHVADNYNAEHTYTQKEVIAGFIKRGGVWEWMSANDKERAK